MSSSPKRQRLLDTEREGSMLHGNPYSKTALFLVREGIQEKRFGLIQKFASKNGFPCEDNLSERVTHIITDLQEMAQLSRLYPSLSLHVKVVSSQWLYSCVRCKALLPEEEFPIPGYDEWKALKKQDARTTPKTHDADSHKVDQWLDPDETQKNASCSDPNIADQGKFDKDGFNSNVLERNAPLQHCNSVLVEQLVFLDDYWTVMGDERRYLAYAKAGATIRCLPFVVTAMEQVAELKGLGSGHSLKVIQETLETGCCKEVLVKKQSEKYRAMKALIGVYGIGSSNAEKFYTTYNIRCVQEMLGVWSQLNLSDERIKYGLAYYTDLNTGVSRELSERIKSIVENELNDIETGYTIEIAGGYRRGKMSGHDVDILIRCKKEDNKLDVLPKLMKQLQQKGYILHGRMDKSTYDEKVIFKKRSGKVSTMDHNAKCFCIFRCPMNENWTPDQASETKTDLDSLVKNSQEIRPWRAVRVDLVTIPHNQWAYGLLGWTGSKLFLRLLRHYTNTSLDMLLNSHGLWSRTHRKLFPADSEAQIFQHLGLSYKEPVHRNF